MRVGLFEESKGRVERDGIILHPSGRCDSNSEHVCTHSHTHTHMHTHTYRYTLMIQLTHLQDWWAGTSYTHFVNSRYQNISLWKVSLCMDMMERVGSDWCGTPPAHIVPSLYSHSRTHTNTPQRLDRPTSGSTRRS